MLRIYNDESHGYTLRNFQSKREDNSITAESHSNRVWEVCTRKCGYTGGKHSLYLGQKFKGTSQPYQEK